MNIKNLFPRPRSGRNDIPVVSEVSKSRDRMKIRVIHNECGEPYMVRLNIFNYRWFSIKMHIILRSDDDRALHDHPWWFVTWIPVADWVSVMHKWKANWERSLISKPQAKSNGSGVKINSTHQADSVIEEIHSELKKLRSKVNVFVEMTDKGALWKKDEAVVEKIKALELRLSEVRNEKLGFK